MKDDGTRRKRTTITIRTDRILVIRGRAGTLAWCPACERRAAIVTADEAAVIVGVGSDVVCGWVASGRLHAVGSAGGGVLVCLDSLLERAGEQ